ncbi:hypothetical protein [Lactococcus lactis]|uniref:hypothetical protein n=1 Tax=Lactococcus lactis TaxID=1358 RepID=UPI0022E03F20|nr:hypothetical protein [Lactococcus lactis]
MGTRTAIFKEQIDGTYQGIYVALDGGIANTGITLVQHYSKEEKIQKLIDQGFPLRSLGSEIRTLNFDTDEELWAAYSKDLKKLSLLGFDAELPYSSTYIPAGNESLFEGEIFLAQNLEEIRTFNYLTINKNGEIQGFNESNVRPRMNWSLSAKEGWVKNPVTLEKHPFTPYRGSDNNGYLYAQQNDGEWLVSVMDKKGEMGQFKPLRPKVQKILREQNLQITSERILLPSNSSVIQILNEQEKEKEMNNQVDLETIYDSQKVNSKQMANQNDYEQELLYTYGGLGEPNYLGTVGEVLHDSDLRESIDEIGIDMLTEYVTNNVRNGGGIGKQDMPSDLFINPTKVDFQKANVKNYEINQNQNLKEFTRQHQVLTIGAELFTEQLEANSNTKGQYFVKINTDTSNHYLSILKKGDENKKEYGKVDFDWSRNSFNMDVMDDKFIKQETVEEFSNIINQVNPATEARVKDQMPKIDLPKLGR